MKGLIVCRTGMGSSLLRTWRDIDFVITMRDLTDEVEAAGFRAVGITDLMNSEEMESALTDIVQSN
ncbi:MAG: PTS ascorbate transporter subunit IIB [Klebsiella michiganensis]|nr:PTS ascorbate transporter subunit IIB [Klebsiella michiganensis]